MFESCTQLWRLVHAFRSGFIGPADFGHRRHLAVALCYAAVMPEDAALASFREDLLRMIRRWGHERKYHETITRFWLAVAAHYLRTQPETQCLATTANGFVERFADKTLIECHYSPALLFSDEARASWITPDRLAVPSCDVTSCG
jgi:hypothetical protein